MTAVTDAIAGVVGSVISTVVFYPVDVWKTSQQATTSSSASYNEDEGGCTITTDPPTATGIVKNETKPRRQQQFSSFFNYSIFSLSQQNNYYRGLSYKIIHIIASSFVYNYVHSLLSSEYSSYCHRRRRCRSSRRRQHMRQQKQQSKLLLTSFNDAMTEKQQPHDEGDSNDEYYSSHEDENSMTTTTATSVGIKLLLTAVAAMINSCITLPLDTISSRKQVETVTKKQTPQHTTKSSNSNSNEAALLSSSSSSSSSSSLWSGLIPALILCTNPAINYTVYEVLKGLALSSTTAATMAARRSMRHPNSNIINTDQYTTSSSSLLPQPTQQTRIIPTRQQTKKLSIQQSFILGLLSKFIATVLTYPLVRCKVMLMVNNGTTHPSTTSSLVLLSSSSPSSSSSRYNNIPVQTTTRIKSLFHLLQYIYKYDGGIYGLYRGCDIQLLHVLLKGALMMMIREHIQQVLGG